MQSEKSNDDHHLDEGNLTVHRMLSQQLRRLCGIDSEEALQRLFEAVPALARQPGIAPEMASFLGGLQQFVARVDGTYDQFDRDLSLRARSLELSSAELGLANERMRADLLTRNRVLQSVRAAVVDLLPGDEEAPPNLSEDDVEGLSALLPRLVKAQEQRRIDDHRMAEKIRESLHFVDALFDAIPIPISLKDTGGRFQRVNTAFRNFYGLDAHDVIGKTVAQLFDLKADSIHLESERRVIESGVTQTYESDFPDGRAADHLVSKAALLAADGSVRGVIATTVDISAQKAAMRAMLQAKDAAESASRAKSDFLANMSHEIRTPMNSVIGMAHLALRTELDARQRDYLVKILISGEHLLGLINDILDFSKIEAGMLTLEAAVFDLDTVLGDVIAQLMGKAAAKGVALSCGLDEGAPHRLRGDALRLSQVLLNLVGNAVKFTANGAVSVRASLVEEDAAACRMRFEVIDSGIGMSEAEIAGLFQPFHQADTSTTREYGGTGLGLAISKRLVEQMGGEVGVDSRRGQGSRFWFVVRMEKDLAPAPRRSADGAARQRADAPALAGASVLLVEDNVFNQQVAAEYLKVAGARVAIAANGVEALAVLGRTAVDCVLMDVQMPLMDGLEATRRIRADPALAHLPVVAMTANASAQDRERCLAAGMDEFITKPVSPDKLYRTLAALLGGRAAPLAPAQAVSEPPAPVPTPDAPPVIDLGVLAKSLNHDAEMVARFAYRFLEIALEGVQEAERALSRQDMQGLAALGHRHKSGARAVGAIGFGDVWHALEQCKESPDASHAGQIVGRLRPMLERIEAQVAAACPRLPDKV